MQTVTLGTPPTHVHGLCDCHPSAREYEPWMYSWWMAMMAICGMPPGPPGANAKLGGMVVADCGEGGVMRRHSHPYRDPRCVPRGQQELPL